MIYPDSFEHKIGFDAVRTRLTELCGSSLGAANVQAMRFSSDFSMIDLELRRTAEMLAIAEGSDPLPLRNMHDVTTTLKRCRIEGASVSLDELLKIRQSLQTISDLHAFFTPKGDDGTPMPYPLLAELCADMTAFPDINRQIDRIIDPLGNMRDNASPYLAEIRSELSRISASVNSIMRRVMARAVEAGYLDKDTTPTVRDGRLVLPVAPMHKRKINGIVHDESATGKTFFIEPAEIVEVNNRGRELELEERREMMRILSEITAFMRPSIPDMLQSYEILGLLDFIMAKAVYAKETGATLPHISPSTELEWYHAVHPVLLESLRRQGKEIIPLDITLDGNNRILIISGPNAGGKSVCLKTVGIVQYMTQCGMLPTVYENSHIGIFKGIFIDIGDDQSIEDDLSTYSSHLRNMKHFLSHGNDATLILIDEFGGGTEPQIGGAIAQAILKEFNDKHLWGVITTHYQNLKHFADDIDGLINGSMLYDRQQMRPLFRLSIGNPGSSFAIEIARKTGLPASIIDNAAEIVGSDYINMDKYLLDIARDRRYWENKRQTIRQKEKKIEQVLERYEEDAETLRSKRREILAEAKEEARKILDGSNAAIERTIREIRESQAEKERTAEARRQMAQEKEALLNADTRESKNKLLQKAPKAKKGNADKTSKNTTAPSAPLAVGDNVKLDGQGTPGKILEINGKDAVVAFGMLKTNVKLNRLQRTLAQPSSGVKSTSFVSSSTTDRLRERQLQFKREIDVRGMRADEAIQAVTYFIDDAIQFNQDEVRILHGTGTGALRQAIRQYLDTVQGVASYRDEHVQFGGAGITVVTLS
ncbi:MAG: Smr/MutS family protein [Muribaculaceae bacterium]|nr:Smr/MutS family protein [Muribaculaceae bacterium]